MRGRADMPSAPATAGPNASASRLGTVRSMLLAASDKMAVRLGGTGTPAAGVPSAPAGCSQQSGGAEGTRGVFTPLAAQQPTCTPLKADEAALGLCVSPPSSQGVAVGVALHTYPAAQRHRSVVLHSAASVMHIVSCDLQIRTQVATMCGVMQAGNAAGRRIRDSEGQRCREATACLTTLHSPFKLLPANRPTRIELASSAVWHVDGGG